MLRMGETGAPAIAGHTSRVALVPFRSPSNDEVDSDSADSIAIGTGRDYGMIRSTGVGAKIRNPHADTWWPKVYSAVSYLGLDLLIRAWGLSFAILIGITEFADAEVIVEDEVGAALHSYLSSLESGGFSGAVLVEKNGHVILADGWGMADRHRELPITPETVFSIASLTKQFTATAVLQLEEQGLLSVEDQLGKFFPSVGDDKKSITIHNLLTHTSGLTDEIGPDTEIIDATTFVQRLLVSQLLFTPGEKFSYSNAGYSVLGIIIEKVTGMDYESHIRSVFLDPLQLHHTGDRLATWNRDLIAKSYVGQQDFGSSTDRTDGPHWNLTANGNFLSTVWDLQRWMRALIEGKVLQESSLEQLFKPHVVVDEKENRFYAYGWRVYATHRGTPLITHGGGDGVVFANVRWYVKEDVLIVLLTNAFDRYNSEIHSKIEELALAGIE